MEENVFYVSPWLKCSRYCSESVLTFSQTFCLEDKCSFLLPAATLELLDFADFPLPRGMWLYPFTYPRAVLCQWKLLCWPQALGAGPGEARLFCYPDFQGLKGCNGMFRVSLGVPHVLSSYQAISGQKSGSYGSTVSAGHPACLLLMDLHGLLGVIIHRTSGCLLQWSAPYARKKDLPASSSLHTSAPAGSQAWRQELPLLGW